MNHIKKVSKLPQFQPQISLSEPGNTHLTNTNNNTHSPTSFSEPINNNTHSPTFSLISGSNNASGPLATPSTPSSHTESRTPSSYATTHITIAPSSHTPSRTPSSYKTPIISDKENNLLPPIPSHKPPPVSTTHLFPPISSHKPPPVSSTHSHTQSHTQSTPAHQFYANKILCYAADNQIQIKDVEPSQLPKFKPQTIQQSLRKYPKEHNPTRPRLNSAPDVIKSPYSPNQNDLSPQWRDPMYPQDLHALIKYKRKLIQNHQYYQLRGYVNHNIPASYHESEDFKEMEWNYVKFISTYGHAPKSAPRQHLTGPILLKYCMECEIEVNNIIMKQIYYVLCVDGFAQDTISYVYIYIKPIYFCVLQVHNILKIH